MDCQVNYFRFTFYQLVDFSFHIISVGEVVIFQNVITGIIVKSTRER